MKKLVLVLGVLLAPGLALAQGTYYVDYYADNVAYLPNNGNFSIIRILNAGTLGSPLNAPACPGAGCICANVYVFDADQEMVACCAQALTPNELGSAYVYSQLTQSLFKPDDVAEFESGGVLDIVLTPEPPGGCNPTLPLNGADATLGALWGTHTRPPGFVTFEVESLPRILSAGQAAFLPQSCAIGLNLASGGGICTIVPSDGQ